MECPTCGSNNRQGANFCLQCGTLLEAPSASPPLAIGVELKGRYRIVQKHGFNELGMTLYLAEDTSHSNQLVMIGALRNTGLDDHAWQQQLARFHAEVEMLRSLNHANLPRLLDTFEERAYHCMVLEYARGQTTEEILQEASGFLQEERVTKWAIQVCDALTYLHSRQPPIIHGDINPDNVVVLQTGLVKLTVYRTVYFYEPGGAKAEVLLATPGYAPLEGYRRTQIDARSDIYSLGATLHYLLTKHDPSVELFNLPPVRQINPDLSPGIEQVIAKALELRMEDRHQTAAEMRSAIERCLQ